MGRGNSILESNTSSRILNREILRCWNCDLNQFATSTRTCRRCHQPYIKSEPKPIKIEVVDLRKIPMVNGTELPMHLRVSLVMRSIRHLKGFSQGRLSQEMGCPRTYISKMESGKIYHPTLRMIEKIAKGFGISMQLFIECLDLFKCPELMQSIS